MRISRQLLPLGALVFAACINIASCAWTQNLSLPLSEKPTDLVEVIYSMWASDATLLHIAARPRSPTLLFSPFSLSSNRRPVVKTKSVDVVSSDFFTDSYL